MALDNNQNTPNTKHNTQIVISQFQNSFITSLTILFHLLIQLQWNFLLVLLFNPLLKSSNAKHFYNAGQSCCKTIKLTEKWKPFFFAWWIHNFNSPTATTVYHPSKMMAINKAINPIQHFLLSFHSTTHSISHYVVTYLILIAQYPSPLQN